MSLRATGATCVRVLEQLRGDPRTLVLIGLVPPGLLALLRAILADDRPAFQRVAVPLVGTFPLILMFMVTSIAMLRERSSGTLERLMAMPFGKLDLLAGYAAAFGLVAAAQAALVFAVGYGILDVSSQAPAALVVVLAVGNALLGMTLGLLLSAFARSEFQAMQFMPAFLLPQLLVCGLLVPRERMPRALDVAAYALPVSYAYDALARAQRGALDGALWRDVGVVAVCVALALALGALTLRRRTR
ncbi:MAG TPA: ABC transporter permease [Gaiellaceae bacterium]|jgi:ABC-2 type transport system permease protein|nr:ABC transporter permease [Gaiellaceae bacterium]